MDTHNTANDQLTTLLNQAQGDGTLPSIDTLSRMLMPFMIVLTVLSIVITVLYILHLVRKHRIDSAILETRDILREMNEREKATAHPPSVTNTTSEGK